jgi:hypothetical protein
MRKIKRSEISLIRFTSDVINALGLSVDSMKLLGIGRELTFQRSWGSLRKVAFEPHFDQILRGLRKNELFAIIGHSLGHEEVSRYRLTSTAFVSQESAAPFTTYSGPDIMFTCAKRVILAAMYDILATERSIALEKQNGTSAASYKPQPALRRFVKKHRLQQLAFVA